MAEGFSQSKIHSHIEDRTMQAGHQLRLGVLPFLKMQTTQREYFLATFLVDPSNSEVYGLIVWHGKISPEVLKCWNCQDFWFGEYYWFHIHVYFSFYFHFKLYAFKKNTAISRCVLCFHHCFRYSLGLLPSTLRNIRLK